MNIEYKETSIRDMKGSYTGMEVISCLVKALLAHGSPNKYIAFNKGEGWPVRLEGAGRDDLIPCKINISGCMEDPCIQGAELKGKYNFELLISTNGEAFLSWHPNFRKEENILSAHPSLKKFQQLALLTVIARDPNITVDSVLD